MCALFQVAAKQTHFAASTQWLSGGLAGALATAEVACPVPGALQGKPLHALANAATRIAIFLREHGVEANATEEEEGDDLQRRVLLLTILRVMCKWGTRADNASVFINDDDATCVATAIMSKRTRWGGGQPVSPLNSREFVVWCETLTGVLGCLPCVARRLGADALSRANQAVHNRSGPPCAIVDAALNELRDAVRHASGTDAELQCANCDRPISSPLRCSRCKLARYCDASCQRKHWKEHKQTCRVPS